MLGKGASSCVYTPPINPPDEYNSEKYVSRITSDSAAITRERNVKVLLENTGLSFDRFYILPENIQTDVVVPTDEMKQLCPVLGDTVYNQIYANGGIAFFKVPIQTIEDAIEKFKYLSRGLQLLHSVRVYHMDLKGDNIVVDKNFVPRLIDFGLSILPEDGHEYELIKVYNQQLMIHYPVWYNIFSLDKNLNEQAVYEFYEQI